MVLFFGNLVALLASLLMVYAGIVKNKKKILFFQIIQILLSAISNLILGGITGAIINCISCFRDILCYYDKLKLKEKIIIILVSALLSISFNNLGIIGFLPVLSLLVYTCYMDTKDIIKFKILIVFSMTVWLIYDLYIKAYIFAMFDFFSLLTNIFSIINITKQRKS